MYIDPDVQNVHGPRDVYSSKLLKCIHKVYIAYYLGHWSSNHFSDRLKLVFLNLC
jgi:hypothetical protein